jgi:hypothetical protein
MATAEQREPYESRGSRTVLGEPGGESPPGHSSIGVLGSMMALEAIREIVGFGEGLVGRLLMVDARAMRFETLRYARDPLNPLNGDALVITDLSGHR